MKYTIWRKTSKKVKILKFLDIDLLLEIGYLNVYPFLYEYEGFVIKTGINITNNIKHYIKYDGRISINQTKVFNHIN